MISNSDTREVWRSKSRTQHDLRTERWTCGWTPPQFTDICASNLSKAVSIQRKECTGQNVQISTVSEFQRRSHLRTVWHFSCSSWCVLFCVDCAQCVHAAPYLGHTDAFAIVKVWTVTSRQTKRWWSPYQRYKWQGMVKRTAVVLHESIFATQLRRSIVCQPSTFHDTLGFLSCQAVEFSTTFEIPSRIIPVPWNKAQRNSSAQCVRVLKQDVIARWPAHVSK